MKKRTAVLISVLAVLIAVGGFGTYSYLKMINGKKYVDAELFSCSPSDIVEYSVQSGNVSYTLEKKDDLWMVRDNHVAVLDQETVQNIVTSASMVKSRGLLTKRELKEFEVISVQAVTVKLKDGISCNLRFVGIRGEACALRINGSEEIYSVHKSLRDILIADLDKLRVSPVFEGLAAVEEPLGYYKFIDYDRTETVVRLKNGAEISLSGENKYIMDRPFRMEVDDEKFEQQIAVRIPALSADKYVDDFPESLEDYGLDEENRATLYFIWGDRAETLYLGKEEGGVVHAIKKGQDGVFVINTSQLEFLSTEAFFLLDHDILETDAEKVRNLIVRTKDETFEITKRGSGEDIRYFVNGKDASAETFSLAVEMLEEIEFVSEMPSVVPDKRDVVIEISYANSSSGIISLSQMNENEYSAWMNGRCEFAAGKKAVDSFIEELRNISKNPMKTNKKG